MNTNAPAQIVTVVGDEHAKQANQPPAYGRKVSMREVRFPCRRCGETVNEWHYPGPLPKYCPACREVIRQEREEQRVANQRERCRRGQVRHRPPSNRKKQPRHLQKGGQPSVLPLSPSDWPALWDEFLPHTGEMLAQLHSILGAQWASQLADQFRAERAHIRSMVGREHAELLTELFNLGDDLSYPALADVDVEAGVEKWSSFANKTAVLQEPNEKHQEQNLIIILQGLDGHAEQFCKKHCLPEAVSSLHPLHLPLSHHIHYFISL